MQYGKRVYQYIFYMLMGCQGAWSPCNVTYYLELYTSTLTVYIRISFVENYSAFVFKHSSRITWISKYFNLRLFLSFTSFTIFNLPKFVKASPRNIYNRSLSYFFFLFTANQLFSILYLQNFSFVFI